MNWAFLVSLLASSSMAMSLVADQTNSTPLKKIKHIVVLMLENRSFDNMLGNLYPKSDGFNGLSGTESNFYLNQGITTEIKVWSEIDSSGQQMYAPILPNPDPGESFQDINEQLFGDISPPADATPAMGGFAQNYFTYSQPSPPDGIMHCFNPEQVPVISQLAKNYAVCDAWFASAPCQTWPNRFFLHTGTAGGYENNNPPHFPYLMPTIFTRFNKLGRENGWKIYFNDFPEALVLSDLWSYTDQICPYSQFKEDAANGSLPSYSFIEPRYYAEVDFPSDQHPPHDVRFGEELIADVYNTIQASPDWKSTLLIITYDEHGGCYDHVAPPKAIPPEPPRPDQVFAFDRYGVRVPAVVISPYIQPGTVFRAPLDSQPFDHTSVIATLRQCFDLGDPLTDRDRNAPDLSLLITLPDDQLNLGAALEIPPVDRSADSLQMARTAGLSNLQKSLYAIADYLPDLLDLEHAVVETAESEFVDISTLEYSMAEAVSFIQNKLNAFLTPSEDSQPDAR